MNLRDASILYVALASVFSSVCDHSPAPAPLNAIESVSFLDRGAVVPDPVRTLVTVTRDSIGLIAFQMADTLTAWSSLLAPEDRSRLVSIILTNNLVDSPDPALPPGGTGCVGHQGMEIVFMHDGHFDTLDISGQLWCTGNRVYWPPGLLSLVTLENALVHKYGP